MDFYFPDSQDQIDPNFDFAREASSPDRVRQRDDRYAHEVISPAPYTGMLLSKALVDGQGSKYTFAQRHRLYRLGVRRFFRLDASDGPRLSTLGDCGAFNYVREESPPYTVEEVIEFYEECGFDYGISVDHVILGYIPDATEVVRPLREASQEWIDRQELTLEYAAEFLRRHRATKATFAPLGVAQGWSPTSYAHAVQVLQKMGYDYIALGGMVPLKTAEIEACLRAIEDVRHPETHFHLLGITRTELVKHYERYGVTSFDSTSPFRQAFKDDRDNYYSDERKYVAIRVMQIDVNHRLRQRVLAGELDQNRGRALEQTCLKALDSYDRDDCSIEEALAALEAYDSFLEDPVKRSSLRGPDKQAEYWRTLHDRPWRDCPCAVCRQAGIDVMIFRGTERNKRRGFHNLFVFNNLLRKGVRHRMNELRVPALQLVQGPTRQIYSFGVDGKLLPRFAAVSRVGRDKDAGIRGYQRPEVLSHINAIRSYIESETPMIPNGIVVAFDARVRFEASHEEDAMSGVGLRQGKLIIPLDEEERPGWIVDGQQRAAAIRDARVDKFPIFVNGFITEEVAEQRAQFILVNSTKPLPKGLIHELLPATDAPLPPALHKRRLPALLMERLNYDHNSPLQGRIRTPTSTMGTIKDNSILKVLENSISDGALYSYRFTDQGHPDLEGMLCILKNFWAAAALVFSEAWEKPPRQSRLTHGIGILSLGFLMDAIAERFEGAEPTVADFDADLRLIEPLCAWTGGTWKLGPYRRKWNDVQNTPRDVQMIADHLLSGYRRALKRRESKARAEGSAAAG